MAAVNTVLGPIAPSDLGITLMHEHILYGYPGWEGDRTIAPLNRKEIVANGVSTLKQLKDEYGLQSYVDATPLDGGRMPEILKEVSEKSGVNIICATGYYYEGEGSPTYWKFRGSLGDITGELYELFMTEVTKGIMDTGIKAGVLKVGSSKGAITDYEKIMFATAAQVSKETGVPIITHTQEGTMGPQQAEFLIDAGANPKQIQIGHMSDNTDIEYQEDTFKHGVYVSWDRMGLQGLVGCPMDAERYPVMIELIKKGYADKMMISHDCIITWLGRPLNLPEAALPLVANWHPSHLFKNIIPELKKGGVTDAQITSIIKENPRRLFAGE
ncbi:MAG: phosphotriesterase-related protein [Deltaproteobacteria bacterium]